MSALIANDASFAADVLNSDVPVLVDFWAPWCGPCRQMTPVVEELATELGDRARVVKVNIDESTAAAQEFGVQAIPTFAVVRDGKVQERVTGAVPKSKLLALLDPHLA